jgi:hypothetical protein
MKSETRFKRRLYGNCWLALPMAIFLLTDLDIVTRIPEYETVWRGHLIINDRSGVRLSPFVPHNPTLTVWDWTQVSASYDTAQDHAYDSEAEARSLSPMAMQWRNSTPRMLGALSPCVLAACQNDLSGSDCAGDSGVILSTWHKYKRCASFSHFGI